MTNDPSHPDYNAASRDAIMDLCPFYDPHHKCGIVREQVFKECLTELRERNRVTLEVIRSAVEEFESINWGWDGDCGTSSMVERLKEHLPPSNHP